MYTKLFLTLKVARGSVSAQYNKTIPNNVYNITDGHL